MLTDPAVTTGPVGFDCNVLSGKVCVVWWTCVSVVEVVAAHDAGEAVVVSECKCLGALVTVPVLMVKEERLRQVYNGMQNKTSRIRQAESRERQAEKGKQNKTSRIMQAESRERQAEKGKQRKASRERQAE